MQLSMQDRDAEDKVSVEDLVTRPLLVRNAIVYSSAPLPVAMDLAGEITGRIDLQTNRQDVDLTVTLYELTADDEYVKLFDPAIGFRASYATDRVQRHLLQPGRRQQIPFRSERLTSRRLAAGSRVVLVLGVNKRPDQQINYGAGNDVSEESITDAQPPMRLRWYSSSYVDLPVRRP
jgi:predicted acyl esterase